jgi:hypothetical protein
MVKTVRNTPKKYTEAIITHNPSLAESKHFHQIDAIFTELEDCLIEAKYVFRQKVEA